MNGMLIATAPMVALLLSGFGMPSLSKAADQEPASTSHAAYKLEAGDSVDIKFFYNEELNTKAMIRPDGTLSLPLLGEVQMAGSSVGELTTKLEKLYEPTLRKPAITLQVEAFANRKIFVGGEVTKPGVFPLTGQQTALGAIIEAGGLTRSAKRGEITLIRRSQTGSAQVMVVSLKPPSSDKLAASAASTFLLEPFDVILLHESGISKANRAIDQYVRQMSPVLLTGGFTYLFNGLLLR
jgi:polysaccharide export outer membrane protein